MTDGTHWTISIDPFLVEPLIEELTSQEGGFTIEAPKQLDLDGTLGNPDYADILIHALIGGALHASTAITIEHLLKGDKEGTARKKGA